MTTERTRHDTIDRSTLGSDLTITTTFRQGGSLPGTWVIGAVAGHKFNALVFPEHAKNPNYELFDSRVSKLWIQRIDDKETVVSFDRGWGIRPNDDLADSIMRCVLLAAAEHAFGATLR